MNKKDLEIIKSIDWRKNFIKRKFCKHDFQLYKATDSSSILLVSGERRYNICSKCGEYKGSIFFEYEGMGFK